MWRGRVLAQLGERLGQLAELARRAGDVADLDVVGVEGRRGLEQQLRRCVGLGARGSPGADEEVGQELDLQVSQPGVVEDLLHLLQRPRLELVLDVRVPQPDALEADPRRLGAAVAPVERAPFAPDVHVGRTGNRPVQGQQLDLRPSLLLSSDGTGQASAGRGCSPAIARRPSCRSALTRYATSG